MEEIISIPKAVTITLLDEVACKVSGLFPDDNEHIHDKYNLLTKDYLWNAHYKLGIWDGKKEFFSKNGKTYIFLLTDIIPVIVNMGYKVNVVDNRSATMYNPEIVVESSYFDNIINPKTKTPYELASHQIEAANIAINAGSGILLAGTGFGKAQPLTSKVLTPTGWRLMGDLQVGDLVITPKNTIARILGIYPQGITGVYEITCNDGATARCCANHLWIIHNDKTIAKGSKPFTTIDTTELFARSHKSINIRPQIPLIPVAIDFTEKRYTVFPYIMGVIIPFLIAPQDGKVMVTGAHCDVYLRLQENLKSYDIITTWEGDNLYSLNTTTAFVDENLKNILELSLNYNDIKIPDEYIYGNSAVRSLFLKGLCDTCADISNTGSISLKIKESLALQVQEMVWLQGGACKVSSSAITIHHKDPCSMFHDKKYVKNYLQKSDKAHGNNLMQRRRVDYVQYVSDEQTQCILIDDSDHLYITDNCLITHNTILNGALIDIYGKLGCRTITVVPSSSLVSQTLRQFDILQLDAGQYDGNIKDIEHQHIVSTWQTLQNNPNLIRLFQVLIVDECLQGDTKITMSDNSLKSIKDISVGDQVLSYNEVSATYVTDTVMKVHKNISTGEKMYKLTFDNDIIIEVTGNHKILTSTGYVRADELTNEHDVLHYNQPKLHNTIHKYNQMLYNNQQQLYISTYTKHRVVLSNGCILSGISEVRRLRNRITSSWVVQYFDILFSEIDEDIRNTIFASLNATHSSNQNKHYFNTLPSEEKEKIRDHMRSISCAGVAASRAIPRWNKGLTKHTDSRIANYAQELSNNRQGIDNPSFGRPKSDEYKLHRSNLLRRKILTGEWTPHIHNSRTHWNSSYNGKVYRSSWEALYAYLNPDDLYEAVRINYEYNNTHKVYIVDFVNHDNKTLTEVKPIAHLLDEVVLYKEQAANQWVKEAGYTYSIIAEDYFRDNIHRVNLDELQIPNILAKVRQFL